MNQQPYHLKDQISILNLNIENLIMYEVVIISYIPQHYHQLFQKGFH